MFRFLELSNFLFSGGFDFIMICVNTFRATVRVFFFYLTLTISLMFVSNTFSRLSRNPASDRKDVAPFSSPEVLRYLLQRESLQLTFSFLGETSRLFS